MKYFYKIFAVLSLFFAILGIFTLNIFLILLCGGAVWYLWKLSKEKRISDDGVPKPAVDFKELWYITKVWYILCLLISVMGFVILFVIVASQILNLSYVQPQYFWIVIFLLGLGLLCYYFFIKIRGEPVERISGAEEHQNSKKSRRVPLIGILLLGIFLAWIISTSYFAFGVVNPPDDGTCDYDNNFAEVHIDPSQSIPSKVSTTFNEQPKHLHEFCYDHIKLYTIVNPVYILSLSFEHNSFGVVYLPVIKLLAEFSIVLWAIFLSFVLFTSLDYSQRNSASFFIWKSLDKTAFKPLILGILGGLSFIVSIGFFFQGFYEILLYEIFNLRLISIIIHQLILL